MFVISTPLCVFTSNQSTVAFPRYVGIDSMLGFLQNEQQLSWQWWFLMAIVKIGNHIFD